MTQWVYLIFVLGIVSIFVITEFGLGNMWSNSIRKAYSVYVFYRFTKAWPMPKNDSRRQLQFSYLVKPLLRNLAQKLRDAYDLQRNLDERIKRNDPTIKYPITKKSYDDILALEDRNEKAFYGLVNAVSRIWPDLTINTSATFWATEKDN